MKKTLTGIYILIFIILAAGCSPIGDKNASLSPVYGVIAVISLLLFAGYCGAVRKKEPWMLLLFASVCVVNGGYWLLSVSDTLEGALWANRLSYLGSVMLPLSMLMTILNVTCTKMRKWLLWSLIGISAFIFLVAASPGYLDIYYRQVSVEKVNGVTVLVKEYGPWHKLYLFYLIGYFGGMVMAVGSAIAKKKQFSDIQAVFLAAAVLVNIGVWLIEQLVPLNFEFLSVSYIISELFLLGLYMLLQEERIIILKPAAEARQEKAEAESWSEERIAAFAAAIPQLTQRESVIFDLYLEGASTKEIMERLNIKENTLKYHNKNIYGKLGVSSRKQLMEIAAAIPGQDQTIQQQNKKAP